MFTLILSFPSDPAHFTPWHPTDQVGPFSKLVRGEFASEQAAHDWARKKGVHSDTYIVREVGQ